MKEKKCISIIIPIHKMTPAIDLVRHQLSLAKTPVEIIFVIAKKLEGLIKRKGSNEKVIISSKVGRGFFFLEGIQVAIGDIILFLHSDTILPLGWDMVICRTLLDKNVVGGGFSLVFDARNIYLRLLVFLSDLFFRLSGELWGDRAIFIRSKFIDDCQLTMNVPIMEDVRLSHCMQKKGKVVLLKEKVTTNASAFVNTGLLRQTLRILTWRLWYALGGDLWKIYKIYYPSTV
ncbi:MAG: hypothetical protein ACFFBD_23515 [Candidatus Hodarchaeota archaeon]